MSLSSFAAEGSNDSPQWGFIGAGKMATALVHGMIRAKIADPSSIAASDPVALARETLGRETGIQILANNIDVVRSADVLLLAIKPQTMAAVLSEIQPEVCARHLVISIAAGVTLAVLESGLGPDCRLIRVMPNTPALVGAGAAGYCLGRSATPADESTVLRCLSAVGIAYRVPERLLDAVTGLSGSGPAFAYTMIEALSDGGVLAGLPRDVATALAAQTVLGAAKMVLETGLHPGALKDQVTSPGGTTISGIHALEKGGIRAALMGAVQAATHRSQELAEEASRQRWDA
jgi:pyrroline-5-carboxylate reductase